MELDTRNTLCEPPDVTYHCIRHQTALHPASNNVEILQTAMQQQKIEANTATPLVHASSKRGCSTPILLPQFWSPPVEREAVRLDVLLKSSSYCGDVGATATGAATGAGAGG